MEIFSDDIPERPDTLARWSGPVPGLLRAIRDTVIPPLCLLCDARVGDPGGVCASCWSRLHHVSEPRCPVMGTPFSIDPGAELLSAEAIADPPPFRRLRFPLLYNDAARRLVAGLKYADRLDLAPWMARWMAASATELTQQWSVVVPVPLHRSRLVARRFNQSAELARHVARVTGLEHAPSALERVRKTRQQVGLGRDARSRNVQGAFRVPSERRMLVKGRQVLLVDDVYTSGATVKSAVRALKRAGASDVDVLCFARVETGELKALYSGN